MDKSNLRLVYSSKSAHRTWEDGWNCKSARQLSFFDEDTSFDLHILAVGDLKFRRFQSSIESIRPRHNLDTRLYPSFFEPYQKTISNFQSRNVIYERAPMDWLGATDSCRRWELRKDIVTTLSKLQSGMSLNFKSSVLLVQSDHLKVHALNFLEPIIREKSSWNLIYS